MNDLLSIAEFADALGISKQAVYKRLRSKELEPYITEKNGMRYISASAMPLFGGEKPKAKQADEQTDAETIAYFKEQLAQKDKTIAELQAYIIEQSKTLSTFIEKQNQIIENQNDLQRNYQILLAKIYDGKLQLNEAPAEEKQENTTIQPVVQPLNNVEQPVETTQKEPFFKRFFKKH